jgi:predicted acyltransferase
MWTSSFVVFTAGLSILLLTLFYIVIDVWDLRKWVLPFLVFGLNPVLIYIVPGSIIDFELVTKSILGGLISHSGTAGPVIDTAGVLLFEFLFLYFLYKNKLFFRV